jgi:hypothetical protein
VPVGAEIVQIFDDAKNAALVKDMTLKGTIDAGLGECVREYFASGVPSLASQYLVDATNFAVRAFAHC